MSGFIKHAKSLTFGQWREHFYAIALTETILSSLLQHPRMCSLAESLSLDLPGYDDFWTFHNVSISEESCSLFFSFEYGCFTDRIYRAPGDISGSEPVEKSSDGERYYYLFDVSAVLHINDEAEISSAILDICAQASETEESTWPNNPLPPDIFD